VRFVARYFRPVVHSALAVLVVAALSRCSWEESRELAQQMSILAQHRLALPSPVQAPVHDCDRESGCICRGATQVVAVVAPPGLAELTDLLPPPVGEFAGSWLSDLAADWNFAAAADIAFPPPISGRELRALYASLVI
jgi:hypothetical protein